MHTFYVCTKRKRLCYYYYICQNFVLRLVCNLYRLIIMLVLLSYVHLVIIYSNQNSRHKSAPRICVSCEWKKKVLLVEQKEISCWRIVIVVTCVIAYTIKGVLFVMLSNSWGCLFDVIVLTCRYNIYHFSHGISPKEPSGLLHHINHWDYYGITRIINVYLYMN